MGELVMYDFSGEVATYPAELENITYFSIAGHQCFPDRLPKYRDRSRTSGQRRSVLPGIAIVSGSRRAERRNPAHDARRCDNGW